VKNCALSANERLWRIEMAFEAGIVETCGRCSRSCPGRFSNRLGQELILSARHLRAGLRGSLHGRRMFAFMVGRSEVACAVCRAAVQGTISPSSCVPAGRIPSC